MVTKLLPENASKLVSFLDKNSEAIPDEIRFAANTFNLAKEPSSDDDRLVSSLLGFYLTKNLVSSGYVRYIEYKMFFLFSFYIKLKNIFFS